MKHWRVLAVLLCILTLASWIAFSDRETAAVPRTSDPGKHDPDKQIKSSSQGATPSAFKEPVSPIQLNEYFSPPDAESAEHTDIVEPEAQTPQTDQLTQQAKALLEQITEELHPEEGLSAYNLMILKDLAIRLNDLQAMHDDTFLQNNTTTWSDEFRDTLQRLSSAFQAETELRKNWQETENQNPSTFRDALLTQQNQILGSELYAKLYAEDEMLIDEAGLSAHYASQEDAPLLESNIHQEKLKLLGQWRQGQLSEAELKTALAESLSADEVSQLIDTGLHETAWLDQIDQFLAEYAYIEQSGIIGEDEELMRQELIEKHFTPDNRAIANQFLFGTQTQP